VPDTELADREDLETRIARADDSGDFGDPLVGHVGQNDVESVVHVGAAARLDRPRGDRVGKALALPLPRVVADGRDAAARGRRGAGLEIVRGSRAAEVEIEMR